MSQYIEIEPARPAQDLQPRVVTTALVDIAAMQYRI